MAIPSLSPEQLKAAREAATHARRARAELKEKVRTGEWSIAKALDDALSDEVLAHVRVVDLLKSMPRVGEKRASDIMKKLAIAPNRRVRGLGHHQLAALKAEFE